MMQLDPNCVCTSYYLSHRSCTSHQKSAAFCKHASSHVVDAQKSEWLMGLWLHPKPFMDPGGNGKQIFGDCWWLDTEGQAPVQSALSDQNLQAYLASSVKPATPKGGPLSHLQAPKFINSALNVFKDRQQAPDVSSM